MLSVYHVDELIGGSCMYTQMEVHMVPSMCIEHCRHPSELGTPSALALGAVKCYLPGGDIPSAKLPVSSHTIVNVVFK